MAFLRDLKSAYNDYRTERIVPRQPRSPEAEADRSLGERLGQKFGTAMSKFAGVRKWNREPPSLATRFSRNVGKGYRDDGIDLNYAPKPRDSENPKSLVSRMGRRVGEGARSVSNAMQRFVGRGSIASRMNQNRERSIYDPIENEDYSLPPSMIRQRANQTRRQLNRQMPERAQNPWREEHFEPTAPGVAEGGAEHGFRDYYNQKLAQDAPEMYRVNIPGQEEPQGEEAPKKEGWGDMARGAIGRFASGARNAAGNIASGIGDMASRAGRAGMDVATDAGISAMNKGMDWLGV